MVFFNAWWFSLCHLSRIGFSVSPCSKYMSACMQKDTEEVYESYIGEHIKVNGYSLYTAALIIHQMWYSTIFQLQYYCIIYRLAAQHHNSSWPLTLFVFPFRMCLTTSSHNKEAKVKAFGGKKAHIHLPEQMERRNTDGSSVKTQPHNALKTAQPYK